MKTLNRAINEKSVAPIKAILNELLRSQEEGNIDAFANCFAQDKNTVNIGTDIDEIWIGWEDFYNWMKEAIQNKSDYTISEKNTRIFLSKNNDIAWYFQLLDTCIESKNDPIRIEGFRHTGVLEKRHNKWLIVQSHISVPDYDF